MAKRRWSPEVFRQDEMTRSSPRGGKRGRNEGGKEGGNPALNGSALGPRQVLALQRQAGNAAVGQLVAAGRGKGTAGPTVQRVAYDLLDGNTIWSTFTSGATQISMTGSNRTGLQTVVPIAAKLDFYQADVPMTHVDPGAMFASRRTVTVLMFKTMDAAPRRRRIGQILTYELGRTALSRGIGYIIAGDVTAARNPFYLPLGFRDVRDGPLWTDLEGELQRLDAYIRLNPTAADFTQKVLDRQAVVDLMAQNKIYIPAQTLVDNSLAAWSPHWRRT